jgi:hypothetical protein
MNVNILSIEQQFFDLFSKSPTHIFKAEDLVSLQNITQRKNEILSIDEATWRLRSRVIWIEKGDKNTSFLHKYVTRRCNQNTIWDLLDAEGNSITIDSELHKLAFNHFKAQYNAIESENIDIHLDVLKMVSCFFKDINNVEIGKPVSISYLKDTIDNMPK